MSDQRDERHMKQSATLAGSTFATMALVDVLAHLGPTGLLVSGIAGYVAWRHGPEIYAEIEKQVRGVLPSLPAPAQQEQARGEQAEQAEHVDHVEEPFEYSGQRTIMDRLLGRYPEASTMLSQDEAEPSAGTRLLPETASARSSNALAHAQGPRHAHDGQEMPPAVPFTPFARVAEDETLRLGQEVKTGQRFDLPINRLLGWGAIFSGSQGSGKSNALALVGEHAAKSGMSQLFFDMKREYSSLLSVLPNGIVVGHPDAQAEIGLRYYPLTLEEDEIAQFAAEVMEKGYQAVFDIPSYLTHGYDWNDVARIITTILRELMAWSVGQMSAEDRLPCLLYFDEAHIWFPQQVEMKSLFSQDVINQLNVAAFNIVNMGRSYGYTLVFSTQRIANIAKWTIGNSQIKVIMRHTLDVDLARCKEEVGREIATERDIKSLPSGYGYVVGLTPDPVLVHFDVRQSRHDSHTPTIDRVKARRTALKEQTAEFPAHWGSERPSSHVRAVPPASVIAMQPVLPLEPLQPRAQSPSSAEKPPRDVEQEEDERVRAAIKENLELLGIGDARLAKILATSQYRVNKIKNEIRTEL